MAHAKSTDPNVFILPDLGEGLEEAELIAWKVEPGQSVEEHEILAEMETDKALVEVPSPRTGVIAILHGGAGDIIKVGAALVTYEGGSGDTPDQPDEAPEPEASEDAGTVVGSVGGQSFNAEPGKVLATPAVRRMARDMGIDLGLVQGTGIGGRVTKKDVEAAVSTGGSKPSQTAPNGAPAAPPAPRPDTRRPMPAAQAPSQAPAYQQAPAQHAVPQPAPAMHPGMMPAAPQGMGMMMVPMYVPMPMGMGGGGIPAAPGFVPFGAGRPVPDPAQLPSAAPGAEARTPFRGVRRTIAGKLRDSVNIAVHFTVVDEADVTTLDAARRQLAQTSGEKVSFLPFVCAAAVRALAGRFGAMNATVDDEASEIVQHGSVHLGIATDTDSGLMVPVVRDADRRSVLELGREISRVAGAARDRSIPREELLGSTFTISNVGSHAGRFATPVINYPEVGILAVGKVYDGVVVRDGQPVVAKVMPLSLACDHRVVDGATAALALAEIVQTLSERAETLLA